MFFGTPGANLYTNEGIGKISINRINQEQNPDHSGKVRAERLNPHLIPRKRMAIM